MEKLVIVLLALSGMFSAAAQPKEFQVLDWKAQLTLHNWLMQKVHEQYAERRRTFEKALKTKKGTQDYIRSVRTKFLQLIGPLPERTPLNPKISGVVQGNGFRIEKLVYESYPDHHVTANLYLPERKGKLPAAILFCGHEDGAKATASYQRTAQLLAVHGFVVLVVDPISQSERYQLVDKTGKPLTRGGTSEHTLLNQAANLLGTSVPAYELWDNVRSLDYLVSRPEVDTTRIGALGNSGGGMQTIYFAAFDQRIKLFAPASYLSSRERTLELSGPADGCAQIPNEGKMGLEMVDYLIAAAPKPVLILAGRYDFIDYEGTRQAYADLQRVYARLGDSSKVFLYSYDDGHGISRPKREAVVEWFLRWFNKDTAQVVREFPASQIFSDKELMVTPPGQVALEFPNESLLPDKHLEQFRYVRNKRQESKNMDWPGLMVHVGKVLNLPYGATKTFEEKDSVMVKGFQFLRIIIRSEGDMPIPALVLLPPNPKKVTIWLHDKGKALVADSVEWMKDYFNSGTAVIMADLRGFGELADPVEWNDPKYYNSEYRNAMISLHIGIPLVVQRASDIANLLSYTQWELRIRNLPIELRAHGKATVPAVLLGFHHPLVHSLVLSDYMGTYEKVFTQTTQRDWYSYVIPGVLQSYDLPDIIRLMEKDPFIKKKVTILDGKGN